MRKYYWYLTSYMRKHGVTVLVSLIVAIAFFSYFVPTIIRSLEQGERQYIGLVGEYTLDSLPLEVARKISIGLTTITDDGSAAPGLAERWIVQDDGRAYRFVLKEKIEWQDGTTVTPDDIQYNFRDVETVTTPNDIVFKLPDPYVPFPLSTAQPILKFAPERYRFLFTRRMPIGIGQYRVVDYKEEDGKLSEIVVDGPQTRYIYRIYQTEDQAVLAFKQGMVDSLPDLSQAYDIAEWDSTTLVSDLRTDRYLAVFFNNNQPIFSKNVRQALSYALPKPEDSVRAIGPINPESWAYFEGGKAYDYDLDRAYERLFSQLPPTPLTFELTTTATFQSTAEDIKEAWEAFGDQAVTECQASDAVEDKSQCPNTDIQINIRVTNFPDLSNFDAVLIGQEIPADPDQYFLWHSDQVTNFTQYKNTRIDALLENGRTTVAQNERLAIYQEFQQFFLEDAPAVFLRYLPSYRIERER